MTTILEYTRYMRQRLEKKGDSMDEPGNGKFDTELILKGPGGLPLIPTPCLGVKGSEVAEILKDVVREYFTIHYSKSTFKLTFVDIITAGCPQDLQQEGLQPDHRGKQLERTLVPSSTWNAFLLDLISRTQVGWDNL
jgi:hypothetical protein